MIATRVNQRARGVALAARAHRSVTGASTAQRGFTLLELLVAMVLFALLSGAVYGAVRMVSRAGEASERAAEDDERLRIVGDFLYRYVAQALPLAAVGAGRSELLFVGERDRVVFVTELPELAGQAGPHEVVLEVGGDDRASLVLGYRPLEEGLYGEFGRGEYKWRVIAGGFDALRIEYHGRHDAARSPEWRDVWREDRRIPSHLRFVLAPRERGEWPELVVQLRVNGLRPLRIPARRP